jgi:hypothetical protein
MSRRYSGVALAGLALLILTSGAGAQDPPQVFIAEPGHSFGPLWIGDTLPPLAELTCTNSALGISRLYYPLLGLVVTTVEPPGTHIFAISAAQHVEVAPGGSGSCSDAGGERVSRPATYQLPAGIYVSNAGITFGTGVQAVIEAHGTPRETVYRREGPRVAALRYCGIAFYFSESGLVNEIVVTRKSDLCP